MKRNFLKFLLSAVLMMCSMGAWADLGTPPNNEIWYTTSDGEPIKLANNTMFGATYKSNTYNDGKGVITFESDVTTIGKSAFYRCSNLKSIEIPKSVTSISDFAFSGCSRLTSIEIPKFVETIGFASFAACTDLTNIKIPELVKSIGESAFQWCSGLASVRIPESVTSIGDMAFNECSGLESVFVEWTDADKILALSNGAFPYETCNLYVPEGTTDIYSGKDCWKKFKSINIFIPFNQIWYTSSDGEKIELTDYSVFGATYKSNEYGGGKGIITFEGDINTIGNQAFQGCSNLTSIRIPESVASVGIKAFYQCSRLTNIELPKSLQSIGEAAFEQCSSLASIEMPNSVTSIENYTFNGCQILASITLPESVTSIGDYAFYNCSSLANVILPNSLKSIGCEAFFHCSNLQSITLPESLESIGEQAFYGTGLKSIFVEWTDDYKIPDLKEIQFPYETCNLYVPYGTTKIYKEKSLWATFKSINEPNLHIEDGNNTVNRYLNSGDDIVIDDDIVQIVTQGTVKNIDVTYTRNFAKADKWQGWYVPFDVPMADMATAGLDVAEIYGILLDNSGNTVLAFLMMDEGTVKANTPYVVRPKTSGKVTVTTKTTLYPSAATDFTINSAKDTYTIGGIYKQTTTPGNWYAINKDGQFQKMGTDVSLRPLRIWMTITPRIDNPYAQSVGANAKIDIMVIGDDETTGITSYENDNDNIYGSTGSPTMYNLNGQKVNSIQKGQIYIINGKKYYHK